MTCPYCSQGNLKFYEGGFAVCDNCDETFQTRDLVGSHHRALVEFLLGNPKLIVVGFTQAEWRRAKERRKLYRRARQRRRNLY